LEHDLAQTKQNLSHAADGIQQQMMWTGFLDKVKPPAIIRFKPYSIAVFDTKRWSDFQSK
jgi:hypothetical protein